VLISWNSVTKSGNIAMSELDQLIDETEATVTQQVHTKSRVARSSNVSFGSSRILVGAIVVLAVCLFWRSDDLWGPADAAIESDALKVLTLAEQEIDRVQQIEGEWPMGLPETLPADHLTYLPANNGYRLTFRVANRRYELVKDSSGRRLAGDFGGGS
jgi:hypothetical protein